MAQDPKATNSLTMDDFRITGVSEPPHPPEVEAALAAAPPLAHPLGPLERLRGTWKGRGFNQIWRPLNGPQDHFLELNETEEVLQFVEIPGDIPNRGLLQPDIKLHGLTYLQKINDAHVRVHGKLAGIHIEPGIWVTVPDTTNPLDPPTVARLANIPHGTTLLAQGRAFSSTGAPTFKVADITPFVIGSPGTLVPFPESNLSIATPFRTPPGDIPNVTQPIVDNPNVVLANGIAGKTIKSVTTLVISTQPLNPPPSGGGTDNICFLQGTGSGPNAQAAQVDAIFWIEEFVDRDGDDPKFLLQYTQRVLLNFAPLSWPHISVATLFKQ